MNTQNIQIESINTHDLIPYAKNAKLHNDAQIHHIAKSIEEFGFNNPVLVDAENGIIAGHGRVLAAKELGLKQIPCIRLKHLSETEKKAYIIADNRLSEIGGGWDLELLETEMEYLYSSDISISLIGFDESFLNEVFDTGHTIIQTNEEKKQVHNDFEYKEKYAVLIECASENEQKKIYEKLTTEGFTCKVLVN